jgi:hypothetical protein
LTLTFSNVTGSTHARSFIYARTRARIQPIYIYDVSGLYDTATGYAGLEATEGRPRRKKIGAIDRRATQREWEEREREREREREGGRERERGERERRENTHGM